MKYCRGCSISESWRILPRSATPCKQNPVLWMKPRRSTRQSGQKRTRTRKARANALYGELVTAMGLTQVGVDPDFLQMATPRKKQKADHRNRKTEQSRLTAEAVQGQQQTTSGSEEGARSRSCGSQSRSRQRAIFFLVSTPPWAGLARSDSVIFNGQQF